MLLLGLDSVSLVEIVLTIDYCLKPLSFFLNIGEFKMYLASSCADYHLLVIHRLGINTGKLKRDLSLI
jgi:hypothetical protein